MIIQAYVIEIFNGTNISKRAEVELETTTASELEIRNEKMSSKFNPFTRTFR